MTMAEPSEETEASANKGCKVCIITGANGGVGLKATEKYAAAGYEVIMACRDQTKAEDAISGIKRASPDAKLAFMKLDLASLKSVRQFVDEFHTAAKPLHVLCNNAGMTSGFRNGKGPFKTEDGFEVTFGINHLGHFLLTLLLLDDLKKTASEAGEARIVMTTSSLHDPDGGGMRGPSAHLDFDNLQLLEGSFNGELAYKNSKLANVLFTKELARRLGESGVTVNALCPGFIPSTGLNRNESAMTRFMMANVLSPMLKLKGVTRTEDQGGECVYHAGTDPSLKGKTGGYYRDCKETESSVESNDTAVAKKLWDVSTQMVNLEEEKNL
ncbi:retinol dehydrogenase 14-like isoform X3 [Acanthaster planci]|uniref:Retinol dehydrogenase 14-like isoform X3 n=1 Tax=Acanthaster planci TaxID=133434 RepID=A0A8B7YN57_ACAPL|nr:retinol dehydrogenase 14-like isoform X3 [Acanthaster planci]